MIMQWLTYLLVLPVLLGIAVTISEPWLRSRAMPTRFLWIGAMVMSLASATLGALPPRVVESGHQTITHLPAVVVQATGAYVRAAAPVQRSADAIAPILLGLVAASALFGLLRLALGWLALRDERATWQRRVVDGCDVLVSGDRGPAVVGITRPAIVLPEWITAADDATRGIVLRHEREHAAARDVATLIVGRLLQALVPWSPGVRWIGTRLTLAIEHDCDLRVLDSGIHRREYERVLLAVADRITAPRLVPSLSESASTLERRIIVMRTLDRRRSVIRPVVACSVTSAALFAAFALRGAPTAAAETPSPVRSSTSSPVSRPAESNVARTSVPVARVAREHSVEPRFHRHAETAARRDTVYLESQVDQPVRLKPFTGAPVYPAEQRAAGVSGEVLVQFVADTLGRMESGSLTILKSDHENFTAAARRALETAIFEPATKHGRKVRQRVQMPFVFSASGRPGK